MHNASWLQLLDGSIGPPSPSTCTCTEADPFVERSLSLYLISSGPLSVGSFMSESKQSEEVAPA